MLYHVSPVKGLKTLLPRVSSHGKPFVYAIDNLVTGLIFGAKKDDFDFMLDVNAQGVTELHECYPHAFQLIYQGKSCAIYEVDGEGFEQGITGWQPEWVCEKEVAVQKETAVPDLYARLLQEEAQGTLIVHRYSNTPAYKKLIAGHIVNRLVRFDLVNHFDTVDPRGDTYFRPLIDGLKSLTDGHLL